MRTHIVIAMEHIRKTMGTNDPERIKGVPRNGGRKQQLVWSCCILHSLCVQTLMLTDAQTPFLETPLVPLQNEVH